MPSFVIYTVRSGDTLATIARRHDLDVGELLRHNTQLTDPDRIYAGRTTLRIPVASASAPAPFTPVASSRVEFIVRSAEGLREEDRSAYQIYWGLIGEPTLVGQLRRAIDARNPDGTPEGVEVVGRASLWRLVSAAHKIGINLDAAGLAQFKAGEGISESGIGPATARALAQRVIAGQTVAPSGRVDPTPSNGPEVRLYDLPLQSVVESSSGSHLVQEMARLSRRRRLDYRTFDPIIREAAERYNLPPELLKAVVAIESDFDSRAGPSSAGAVGLMQMIPGTARQMGVTNSYDPRDNLFGGSRYLRKMADRYDGDVHLMLAAYNAGPGNVARYNGVPPFRATERYIKEVLMAMQYYRHFGQP